MFKNENMFDLIASGVIALADTGAFVLAYFVHKRLASQSNLTRALSNRVGSDVLPYGFLYKLPLYPS